MITVIRNLLNRTRLNVWTKSARLKVLLYKQARLNVQNKAEKRFKIKIIRYFSVCFWVNFEAVEN